MWWLLAAHDAAGQARAHDDRLLPSWPPGMSSRALTVISTKRGPSRSPFQLFHGQNSAQWGLVFAASLIAILPVIVVYLVFQRPLVAGLTAGP